MPPPALILDRVFDHETERRAQVFLTQPVDGGVVIDIHWGEAVDQARRMAAHLKGLGFAPGSRIAILSKNCAHFIIAELAIWMAGGTTVAIFPTETADTVRYVLEHSEASLLFIGKLDKSAAQAGGFAVHRAAFHTKHRTADNLPALGRHRRCHGTPTRSAATRARRPGDAVLHVGLDRPAQGRDAQLRPHHADRAAGHR
jgi:long-subunit acyl-CoA synthetase (AMP-forming)